MTEIQNLVRWRSSIQVDRVLRCAVAHDDVEKTVIVPIRDRGTRIPPTRFRRSLNIHPIAGLNMDDASASPQGHTHFEGRSLVIPFVFEKENQAIGVPRNDVHIAVIIPIHDIRYRKRTAIEFRILDENGDRIRIDWIALFRKRIHEAIIVKRAFSPSDQIGAMRFWIRVGGRTGIDNRMTVGVSIFSIDEAAQFKHSASGYGIAIVMQPTIV